MDSITPQANQDCTESGFIFEIHSLYAYLNRVIDPRKLKGLRYQLATILLMVLVAKLGGQDNPTGISEWAKLREVALVEMLKLPCK
jgi:hypothetical protein